MRILSALLGLALPLGAAIPTPQSLPTQALPERAERRIQIGIIPKAATLTLSCEDRCVATDARGRAYPLSARKGYEAEATQEGLRLGPLPLPGEARVEPKGPSDAVVIGKKRYRGSLILRPNQEDGTLTVIDELGIEDYLQGVLPQEMDPSWPVEALKAQAVVARTFAYTQLGKYRKAGFDLTSDTRSQVFGGLGPDLPSVRRALDETRGEVLGYKGQILSVYYHSCCGGHTANAGAVWGGPTPPPLLGVRDRYCDRAPNKSWTAYFSTADILAAVQQSRLLAGPLRGFDIGRQDLAGYVRTFLVKVGRQKFAIKAADFRKWMGNGELKSTRISRIRNLGKGLEFIGSGSGHGVGLCQWGARLQAERGRHYEQILSFYFPGSILSVIDE